LETEQIQSSRADLIYIEVWPTEHILLALVILASLGFWFLLFFSIIGIVYAVFIILFLFIGHLTFVTYIRGSAVRLGPDQFPELYNRVQDLAARAGITEIPEAYIMQEGGTLNALATRFFRSNMIVLFSDLLDACGDNEAARDMIIGHELGHIKEGHLKWFWFIFPGMLVPFIGSAYSRAREYTCDRYGAALCRDKQGALLGMAILAAGAVYGPKINLSAFVNQRQNLDTGFMTLGKWLSTYPQLCERIAAIEPLLIVDPKPLTRGTIRAFGIISGVVVLPMIVGVIISLTFISKLLPEFQKAMNEANLNQQSQIPAETIDVEGSKKQVEKDFIEISKMVEEIRTKTGKYPLSENSNLSAEWKLYRKDQPEPIDPFDGRSYGYYLEGESFLLWSSGPDRKNGTEDDIYYDSVQNTETKIK
jgi:Zn-dependent protease with chaperone function